MFKSLFDFRGTTIARAFLINAVIVGNDISTNY